MEMRSFYPRVWAQAEGWYLLIHQLPTRPIYLRARIGERLARLGALALKNSVYVLPNTEPAREDFEWLLREIVKDGGDATLCEARLVEGLRDEEVVRSFHAARDTEYAAIAEDARKLERTLPARLPVEEKALRDRGDRFLRRCRSDEIEGHPRVPAEAGEGVGPRGAHDVERPRLGYAPRRSDRPHRLCVADSPLHRSRGMLPVHRPEGGEGP
jgi:hypothetical protein